MGNLIFLSRRNGAAVTDAAVCGALMRISTQRFRGQLGGDHESTMGWRFTPPGAITASWTLWRTSARKFECKFAHGPWNRWVQELVLRHLAIALDLRMSDEGVNDPPWIVRPRDLTKIRTFRRWLVKEYNPFGDWRAYMKFVPDAWRDVAGRP